MFPEAREATTPESSGVGRWLTRTLRPGDVVFDVGANVGRFTGVAADIVGQTGHVYAFEPGSDNVSTLRTRFATASHVTVIGAAVGDSSGTTSLYMDRRDPRRHSLAVGNVGKAGPIVTVPQMSLDDYARNLTRLDVIKVDAQGAEVAILRGAAQVIRQFKPTLVLELWPTGLRNFGASADELLTSVRELGYSVHRLSAEGVLKDARHIESVVQTTDRWKNIDMVCLSTK